MKIVIRKIKESIRNQEQEIISEVLKNEYGINNYNLFYSDNGKPYLDNNIFISISHSNDLLAMVFDDKNVGIDIEFYRDIPRSLYSYLKLDNSLTSKEVIDNFSKREAIIKLEGMTLSDINKVDIKKYNFKSYSNSLYTLNIVYK